MGLFDRWRSKPVRKASALERMVSSDIQALEKEARTPVYSGVSTDRAYRNSILPPVDQHYLEQLADRYSHLRTEITRLA